MWNVFSVHIEYKNSHGELRGRLIQVQAKFGPKLGWALRCTGTVWKGAQMCLIWWYLMCTRAATSQATPTVRCSEAEFCHQIQHMSVGSKAHAIAIGAEAGWTLQWKWERQAGQMMWEACYKQESMPEGVFLVSVDCVCGTQARGQKQSRYPVLLENEVFHFSGFSKYPRQTLWNVYIRHFQGNLLNGLYSSWPFKAEFMSLI